MGGTQNRRSWGDEQPEEEEEEEEENEDGSRDEIYALCSRRKNLCHESFLFLDAFSHLYKRVCPSVRLCARMSARSVFQLLWRELVMYESEQLGILEILGYL